MIREIRVVNMRHVGYVRGNMVRIDRETPYGNSFHHGLRYDRATACKKFEATGVRPELLDRLVAEVQKVGEKYEVVFLGCHCKPQVCHGDVWKKFLHERGVG